MSRIILIETTETLQLPLEGKSSFFLEPTTKESRENSHTLILVQIDAFRPHPNKISMLEILKKA